MLAACLPLSGCDRARVFEDNADLKDYIWPARETPAFTFELPPPVDPAARYTVYLNVRNIPDYPFYNLFAKLTLTDPTGRVISRRLHEMELMDRRTGEPLGKGTGDIYDHQFVALRGVRLPLAGTYKAQVEQYMRVPLLPGIMSVGVRVEHEQPIVAK